MWNSLSYFLCHSYFHVFSPDMVSLTAAQMARAVTMVPEDKQWLCVCVCGYEWAWGSILT